MARLAVLVARCELLFKENDRLGLMFRSDFVVSDRRSPDLTPVIGIRLRRRLIACGGNNQNCNEFHGCFLG